MSDSKLCLPKVKAVASPLEWVSRFSLGDGHGGISLTVRDHLPHRACPGVWPLLPATLLSPRGQAA